MTALTYAAALLLGTLASARATRLITHDAWPPMAWARTRAETILGRHGTAGADWAVGVTCPFCVAPYVVAANLAWCLAAGALTDLTWTGGSVWSWAGAWWVLNTWAAVAYVASMVVVRDEPPEEA